jgi:hypothetical protein
MSGASAHKSRTQRQARRLAADLAKGRMPASTVDLEDYLDRSPMMSSSRISVRVDNWRCLGPAARG